MPFLDYIIGNIQIQERRPRSKNEPREKRLCFVRPRNSSSRRSSCSISSDEWSTAPLRANVGHCRGITAFCCFQCRSIQQCRDGPDLNRGRRLNNPRIQLIRPKCNRPRDLRQSNDHDRRVNILEIRPRQSDVDSDDEIISSLDGSDSDDDDSWDSYRSHIGGRPLREPLSFEQDSWDNHHGHYGQPHRVIVVNSKKDKGRLKRSKEYDYGKKWYESDADDSNSDDTFMEGVKTGIKMNQDRRSNGHWDRIGSGSLGRLRRFPVDSDSDDGMDRGQSRRRWNV